MQDKQEHTSRHRRIWRFLRKTATPFLKRKFHYTFETCEEKGPLLVLCNHNTDWDPLLLGIAFPDYLSFVASEQVFRWGWMSRLIVWLVDPIARVKGQSAVETVITILRKLKSGVSVAMFAEGNRSFNGLTGPIPSATGKLAKKSKATLVTYRLDGGYFTTPRWGNKGIRKGKMAGHLVHVYSPETLKSMSVDQINEAIRQDLYVDAYALQREQKIRYKTKAPAEHLERVLCLCPACGQIGTLKSAGDRLSCSCGFSVRYNEFGFLEGENAPFDNITEWDAAQTEKLYSLADNAEGMIFSDQDMILKEIHTEQHTEEEIGRGTIALYPDRLECCGRSFPLEEMEGFSLFRSQTADLTCGGKHYEISSEQIRCMRKYMTVIRHFRQDLQDTV